MADSPPAPAPAPPSRSRSQSPGRSSSKTEVRRPRSRSRSRSPRRKPKSDKGFRWKEKPRRDDAGGRPDDRGPSHGYRSRRDDPYLKRDGRDGRDGTDSRDAASSRRERTSPRRSAANDAVPVPNKPKDKDKDKEKRKEKPAPVSNEPMIIVTVNDRLGTKAAIPCLASDPIKLFKAQVAARIGRQPHEIMLKRQGERPMKDMLTLEDYGVSSGVQLDLELDTGD